jgi:hypothetical protein
MPCAYNLGAVRKALLAMVLSACAHEREKAALALGCGDEQTALVAEGPARIYQRPRETGSGQAALSGAAAAVGALTAMVGGGPPSAAYYLPAGSTQLGAPGWRHYEGCRFALVCFDGGFCVKGAELEAARRVPQAMERSERELTGKLEPETECMEPKAYADRRGLLTWTLSRCSSSFTCKVADGGYSCTDVKGRAVEK